MTFNSIPYLLFLPAVFSLYWLLQRRRVRWQNALLLGASYLFYGWWDWRFLGLLLLSTGADFILGLCLEHTHNEPDRKRLLYLSLAINLGLLGFFKYFNFFTGSFTAMAAQAGWQLNPFTLRIILPVGISFYTFQSLSYTLDIYRRRIPATRDAVAFAAFVAFFPQLVAGPIERAGHLLPQFLQKRRFDYAWAASGCRLILWGLLKKVVIADNLAPVVECVFNNPGNQNTWTVILGTLCFAGQIYGDFSGYSDIAVGSARLLGFDLMQNFRTPYFAGSIREFWQRWHISLSTWFRDYVYIPLGGNKDGMARQVRNLLITFALSGLWHGANWTFVVWGLWHGTLAALETLSGRRTQHLPGKRLLVFTLVCIGWIFFRADTLDTAFALLGQMGTFGGGLNPVAHIFPTATKWLALAATILLVGRVEWTISLQDPNDWFVALPKLLRWALYYVLVGIILLLGVFDNAPVFIYFQF